MTISGSYPCDEFLQADFGCGRFQCDSAILDADGQFVAFAEPGLLENFLGQTHTLAVTPFGDLYSRLYGC